MIKEDYVSYEVAKLLKDRGFDEKCIAVYEEKILRINTLCDYLNSELSSYVCAPTHQMACKWLREFHNIFISIVFCTYPTEKRVTWTPEISTFDSVFPESAIEYDSYEEAVEAALKYCLENLI